ncbi:MAG TPA: cytochrome c [Allosphingosinicella sp.]|nr:cytochrome c [Allosphingosinicella sp.]
MVRKILRWLGYILLAILALLLIGAAWIWFASSREIGRIHSARPETLAPPTPAQLGDAVRQARLLGCFSCHGEGLRGRLMFKESGVAEVWAPNLTEVAARADDQQLARAIRQGIGADGRALWVMPSPMYSRLSDGEVAALIAVIRRLPRAGEATPPVSLGPLGRFGIATGRFRPATAMTDEFRVRQPYQVGREHEAGRRLASINCSECHGPDLGGGRPGPDAAAPGLSIAGAYDLAHFRTLMRTGRPPDGRDLGLMRTVARQDFSHLTDEEIAQLHGYLQARAERVQDPPVEP